MQLVKQQMVAEGSLFDLETKVNSLVSDGGWVVVPGTVALGTGGAVCVLQETPDMEMMQKMAMMRQQMAGGMPPEMRGGGAPPAAPGGMGKAVPAEEG